MHVFLSGCFGGAATPLLEFIADMRAEGLSQAFSWGEFFGIAGLAVVGGVFVLIQKETDMKKALYLGVTAPALLLGVGQAADAPSDKHQRAGLIPQVLLVQPLHAAGQPAPSGTRSISIETDADIDGDFYTRSGNGAETRLPRRAGTGGVWVLPSSEVTLLFRGRLNGQIPVETPWTEIPSGAQPITVQLDVGKPRQTFWGGFLDSLGLDNRARAHVRSDAAIRIQQEP